MRAVWVFVKLKNGNGKTKIFINEFEIRNTKKQLWEKNTYLERKIKRIRSKVEIFHLCDFVLSFSFAEKETPIPKIAFPIENSFFIDLPFVWFVLFSLWSIRKNLNPSPIEWMLYHIFKVCDKDREVKIERSWKLCRATVGGGALHSTCHRPTCNK